MSMTQGRLWLLAAVPILLAGCASAQPTSHTAPCTPKPSGTSMSPAKKMPAGTTMPETLTAAGGPSQSATMVCSTEIRKDVQMLLALTGLPAATATWANHMYTCTYRLADGPLMLSVTESGTVPAAGTYFTALQKQVGASQPIHGLANLGLPAFETSNGTVAFVKDDKTLRVDATKLPQKVGTPHFDRSHLAYTIGVSPLLRTVVPLGS